MCVDRSFPASSGRRGGCARGPSHPLFGKQPRRGRPGRTCWEPASGTPLLGPREQLQFTLPRAFRTPGARARLGWGPPPQNTHPHSLGLGHALPRVRAEGAQPTPGGQGSICTQWVFSLFDMNSSNWSLMFCLWGNNFSKCTYSCTMGLSYVITFNPHNPMK